MRSILLIYTGGTIGMIQDEETGLLKPFDFDYLSNEIPELKKLDYQITTICFDTPIDSSDMQPETWGKIAKIIENNYAQNDGFVILHGSDTMAYTASALSFMLERLSKPVILTGSQLPIGIIRTDAKENLLTAIEIAAAKHPDNSPVIKEVAVYFEYHLYRGKRTTKISAQQFDAFASPNYPPLAEAGVHIDYAFEYLKPLNENFNSFNVFYNLKNTVASIKLYPGIRKENIECLLSVPHLQAVVFETFGSGNGFTAPWFLEVLKKFENQNILIVNKTQCLSGKVEQGKYATSSYFTKVNALSAGDMTFEATITKLMYLLGKYSSVSKVREQFLMNISGELSS
ncbi:MAG TPA: L-asparaginase 1 [Flavobacteriales bacterium]|nr:L-asparaginase 1 [Flavobacteriales bacterium]